MSTINVLTALARNRTTYRAGLLQNRAFRVLKHHTNRALADIEDGITSVHWALLGILYDAPKPLRPRDAAEELGVEPAFVTTLVSELLEKDLIESAQDEQDSRAKNLSITKKGKSFVARAERHLRSAMRPLVIDASSRDLAGYVAVLESIVKRGEEA